MSNKKIIKPGDRVRIKAFGNIRIGVVKTAHDYGTPDKECWYIELKDEDFGPVYWKQDTDGGVVVNLTTLDPLRGSLPLGLYEFACEAGLSLARVLVLQRVINTARGKHPRTTAEWQDFYDVVLPFIEKSEQEAEQKGKLNE